ncbi:UNVERIFIED_CONTAM: hypothetical protein Sangu_1335800 [Sesamum angustifolium]|uniref:Uncharacterized protein n=1 Tax=Sesamum angustifolium TaxID=2727405 RepID=A0AAW2N3S0_9LAMI
MLTSKKFLLGVTAIADIKGPYTPLSGMAVVPFPVQYKWISRVKAVADHSENH